MSNPVNSGNVIGRLAADPVVFENKDSAGNVISRKVSFTLYVDRDYRNAQGQYDSDKLPIEAWLNPGVEFKNTPFGHMYKGSQITVSTELRCTPYQKNGETIYDDVKIVAQKVKLLESKAVTDARLERRVAGADIDQPTQNDEWAQPVAVEVPAHAIPAGEPAVLEPSLQN